MERKIISSKRGVSVYLGWVLLMAFAVMISTFMYGWMTTHVEEQTKQIDERADEHLCDSVTFSIIGQCQDNYEYLFNITNTNTMRIEGFKIRLFDIYDEPFQTSINTTLKPSQTLNYKTLKHGTLAQAELIPLVISKDRDVYCEASKVILQNIPQC